MFVAVYAFWLALAEKRRTIWVLCGTATGLALLAKFTALLLGPIFILLTILHVIQCRKEAASVLKGPVIAGGVSILVVGAGYNLTFNPLLYLDGLCKVYTTGAPGYQYYLFGEASEKPWWYYHLVVFALKTPVPVLLLIVLAIGGIFIQKENRLDTGFLAIPAILMLLVSCFDQTNLGFRRILPAVPFLLLLTGHVTKALRSRSTKWVYACLVLITVLSSILAHPHYLSFFNQIAGGQDLPAFARWQAENRDAGQLKLMYFGNVRPEHYGVRALPIPEQDILRPLPGYYAISAHNLAWLRKIKQRTGQDIDWLSKHEPVSRAGFSIYLYNFPRQP